MALGKSSSLEFTGQSKSQGQAQYHETKEIYPAWEKLQSHMTKGVGVQGGMQTW